MTDRHDDDRSRTARRHRQGASEHDHRADAEQRVPAGPVVEAQVRAARSEVFRAYLRSRERARELADLDPADDEHPDPPDRGR